MKRKPDSSKGSGKTAAKPRSAKKIPGHPAPKEPEVLTPEVADGELDESATEYDAEPEEEPEIPEPDGPDSASPAALSGNLPTVITGNEETSLVESEPIASSLNDPLRRYLEEVRRYPLLEPEEEFRLALRLRDEGDVQAAKALVSANLRLVVKIALEYRTFYSNLLDLIQEGNIGLMKAVSKFDPTRGARLGYYASWWIRSYILKYLLDNFRLVKIGTTQAQKKLFYHLMREKERLEAQGLLGGPKLLAEKLNVREKDIIEMEQRLSGSGAELSLDAPIQTADGSAVSHLDHLADPTQSVDTALEHGEMLSLLRRRLPEFQKTLNDKEKSILDERLLAEEPKTLQEVADRYGLTRERARQIEAKVIEKLRLFLKTD